MPPARSLLVTMTLLVGAALQAAAPPVSSTPGAMRLGSDRLRIGSGRVVVAPNGRMLAASETGGVSLWDLPSGKVSKRFEYAEYYEGVPYAFCPDSRWLALGLHQYILDESNRPSSFALLDVQTGKRFSLKELDEAPIDGQAAFLDRGRVVCYLDWNSETEDKPGFYDLHFWALPSRKYLGRISDVTCFATTPGSDVIVTGHKDGCLRFCKAGDLNKSRRVKAHSQSVEHLALSPDGRLVASSCAQEARADKDARPRPTRVVVWDVASRTCLRMFRETRGEIGDLRFTANHTLSVYAGESLSVYDVRTGRAITPATITHNGFNPPSFSADGSEVVTINHELGRVEVRRVTKKEPVLTLRGTPEPVFQTTFVNGGRSILLLGPAAIRDSFRIGDMDFGWDGTRWGVWDRATGDALHEGPGHRAKIVKVDYSQDGQILVSLDEAGELRLTRLPSGTPHPSFSTRAAGWVKHFQLTPDGKQLCAIEIDGHATFWDIETGKRVRSVDLLGKELRDELVKSSRAFWSRFPSSLLGENLVLDANCRVAVVRSSDKHFEVVRLDTGKRTRFPFTFARVSYSTPMVISGDGHYLAANRDYGFKLYDLSNDKVILDKQYGGSSFAFSTDERYFAWDEGNDVCLFDLQKRTKASRLLSDDEAFSPRKMTFGSDGKTLAASDLGSPIIYWDLATKTRLETGLLKDTSSLTAARLISLRSGAILSSETFLDEGRTVPARNVTSGMGLLPRMSLPEGEGDYQFAVSPDGRVIAYAGRDVTLIERYTGKEIARLPRYHRGLVSTMTFSPDGQTLTTGATDASVFVWHWKTLCGLKPRRRTLSASELLRCEHGLSSEHAGAAYGSMGMLAGDPDRAVPLFEKILAASSADGVRVAQWLRDLDDDSFEKRERAARELAGLGGEWTAALREVVAKTPSAEVRTRIARLLAKVSKADWSPSCIRTLRTIAMLEEIGTPAARLALTERAKGTPSHPATREAGASLTRMKR